MRGQIKKALSGFYYVASDEALITCRARGRFRREGLSPLVGDFVEVSELHGSNGVIDRIEERKNCFDRPAVANIDQLVIVCSQALPQTDPFLVDRMTAIAALKHCEVLICVNKCDLDRAEELLAYYKAAHYRTVAVSAETGDGVEELRAQLTGRLSAFTGNSGVGKSSLLNALDPQFSVKVGEVSQALGRGRHTTRHVEIYELSGGARVIDTPGFSSFDARNLELSLKAHLEETFPDFAPYTSACRFTGCSHTKEKGCAVLEALKAGEIVPGRHRSYVRLYEELKNVKEWNSEEKR